jgi:membrane-bound lytic murein transglycosylase D
VQRNALPGSPKGYTIQIPLIAKDNLMMNRVAILDSASKIGKKELEILARNSEGSTYGRDRIVYRVRSGDVLGKIAIRHNVRVNDIKKWNNLSSNNIRVGQRLNIWLKPSAYLASVASNSTSKTSAAKEIMVATIPTDKLYVVQPGDTLWDISRKFEGLTIEKIKSLNKLANNKIHAGQKLIIAL